MFHASVFPSICMLAWRPIKAFLQNVMVFSTSVLSVYDLNVRKFVYFWVTSPIPVNKNTKNINIIHIHELTLLVQKLLCIIIVKTTNKKQKAIGALKIHKIVQ